MSSNAQVPLLYGNSCLNPPRGGIRNQRCQPSLQLRVSRTSKYLPSRPSVDNNFSSRMVRKPSPFNLLRCLGGGTTGFEPPSFIMIPCVLFRGGMSMFVLTISAKYWEKIDSVSLRIALTGLVERIGTKILASRQRERTFGKSPTSFGEQGCPAESYSAKRVQGCRQRAIKNTFDESPNGHRRTAKWFGELDLAHQMTYYAYFQPNFSNSTPQPPKTKSKHAQLKFKQDP
ncbi:hypothetical protein H5410_001926 [Solanum commersonii]|uniref:Uncharacterized protein n=1 Tax=Solanum commersonii TaxID=4109 RepID=A0A9J6B0J3_SOLCO|nr:hypothetical protein H5410_001926 [Solanum commersonii]